MNYYNEIDKYPAQWLRNLIDAGQIPKGTVDERSILEVVPDEISQYKQAHFFAGIGGWPYALRLAGWPILRPVWTGSCPCQPFSNAGKGKGVDDPRHLWPAFRWLISQCRPPVIFGEQVASNAGRDWLAGIRADLEAMGYEVGAADLCAAGVGAPHIRQRLFWVGHSVKSRSQRWLIGRVSSDKWSFGENGMDDGMADPRLLGQTVSQKQTTGCEQYSKVGGMAHPGHRAGRPEQGNELQERDCGTWESSAWRDSAFIPCADGKARRIEPRIMPLAHGVSARVGKIRAYGNAIVPQVAAIFIKAFMEIEEDKA